MNEKLLVKTIEMQSQEIALNVIVKNIYLLRNKYNI